MLRNSLRVAAKSLLISSYLFSLFWLSLIISYLMFQRTGIVTSSDTLNFICLFSVIELYAIAGAIKIWGEPSVKLTFIISYFVLAGMVRVWGWVKGWWWWY